uniref:Ig-like domain-containing protein n=1 Tax=Haplochromis burtoni TaxID=8153 RepID=A0A3Q2VMJ0_HAPBU
MQQNDSGMYFCSSLSDRVHQNPADMYKNPGQAAEITCSHSIDSYDVILWYKQTENSQLQLLGYMLKTRDVLEPGWMVEIKGSTHFNISGDLSGDDAKNASLFIVDLKAPEHSAVYYCAASFAH